MRVEEWIHSRLESLRQWLSNLTAVTGLEYPALEIQLEGQEPRLLKEPQERGSYEAWLSLTITCKEYDLDLVEVVKLFEIGPCLSLKGLKGAYPSWTLEDVLYLEEGDLSLYEDARNKTYNIPDCHTGL